MRRLLVVVLSFVLLGVSQLPAVAAPTAGPF
jgi:hypothetical protein